MKRVIKADISKDIKSKELRKLDKIPACCYGPGLKEQLKLNLDKSSLSKLLAVLSRSTIVDMTVDGKKIPVLLHEIQRDPVTEQVLHVDFYAIDATKPVTVTIPLFFEGNPDGVRVHHGVLVTEKNELNAKCLPEKLVDGIKIDTNVLDSIGSVIHVSDLEVPEGIEFLDNPDNVIAHIVPPKLAVASTEDAQDSTTQEIEEKAGPNQDS